MYVTLCMWAGGLNTIKTFDFDFDFERAVLSSEIEKCSL